jgi:hypothetical protein
VQSIALKWHAAVILLWYTIALPEDRTLNGLNCKWMLAMKIAAVDDRYERE